MGRRKPKRWPWKSGVVLALLLALWPVSYAWSPHVMLWRHQTRLAIAAQNGHIHLLWLPPVVSRADVPFYLTVWHHAEADRDQDINAPNLAICEHARMNYFVQHPEPESFFRPADPPLFRCLGLVIYDSDTPWGPPPSHLTQVIIPLWQLAALLGLWVLWRSAAAWRHRRRWSPGHCQACGYDLRATPARCPECGTTSGITPLVLPYRSAWGKQWARAGVRIRREAAWIAAVLLLLGLLARPWVAVRPEIAPVPDPRAFVQAHRPPRPEVGDDRFQVWYNVADLPELWLYADLPSQAQGAAPVLVEAFQAFQKNLPHEESDRPFASACRPYLRAWLTAPQHEQFVEWLNAKRREKP